MHEDDAIFKDAKKDGQNELHLKKSYSYIVAKELNEILDQKIKQHEK